MTKLWKQLDSDLLNNFPQQYTANIQLMEDILTYRNKVHPCAVTNAYFTIISGLTAEYFFTQFNSSTTLFNVAIAPTGSGKDVAVKVIADVFNSLNHDRKFPIENNILTSKITSVSSLDKIFEDNRLIVQVIDEFGDTLGKMQGGGHAGELLAMYKELYSLTNGKYESGTYARSNKANDDKVEREFPCFVLSGLTTKTQLLERLKLNMIHDGFLNRFIVLEGSHLKPYISKDINVLDRKTFQEVFDFYDNVHEYENTVIKLSKDALDYYWDFIGDPYSEGTDIANFCEEYDEDFETNSSISNRWRENAIRLATAITAYEFGVNSTKEDILKFQKNSQLETEISNENTALNNIEVNDFGGIVIENTISEIIKSKIGNSTDKELYKQARRYAENTKTVKSLKRLRKNKSSVFNKPNEVSDEKHLEQLMKEVKELEQEVPIVEVQKDILEWAYTFIKRENIKFYNIFHEEVEETKYNANKRKAIDWFKRKHIDSNTWHELSDLARDSRPFKNAGSSGRKILLNDLIEEGLVKEDKRGNKNIYQYIPQIK